MIKIRIPIILCTKTIIKTIKLENDVNVYIPTSGDGCYVTKTPCIASADGIYSKKFLDIILFKKKIKMVYQFYLILLLINFSKNQIKEGCFFMSSFVIPATLTGFFIASLLNGSPNS